MELSQSRKTALVFGATGLVGKSLVTQLLRSAYYARVRSLGRRKLEFTHPKLEQEIVDFERLEEYRSLFKADDVFSCLGTTRAKAGSKEAFYRVDFTYAYQLARLSAEENAHQYLLVSSAGADVDSPFFYSQVKGELEEAVRELPFWAIHIFRPSVLEGERAEMRLGETLAARVLRGADFLSGGRLAPYRPIEAETVAMAMLRSAQLLQPGFFIRPNEELEALAAPISKRLQERPRS
jgi:uncharacterized protein YbjT (DUF2867 family)